MKVIEPYIEYILFHRPEGLSMEECLERAGRTCYKSEDKITDESAPKFVRMLRKRGHHAMLEHAIATVKFVADRGLTHELVRHRLASFGQESTRYCNYSKGKFNSEITVVQQPGLEEHKFPRRRALWVKAMEDAERHYFELIEAKVPPEIARSVLPIGLKAEIVMTANLREWRHVFKMRCDKYAHPIIRGLMLQVLARFNEEIPSVYEDQAEEFLKEG